jgi:hypothetical protein
MTWNPDHPEEQRRHRRISSRIEANLFFEGSAWRCFIVNISPGGAGLEPAIPAALGRMVELRSPRFSRGLLARVVNVTNDQTNLAFELDETMQYELAKFLATSLAL